MHIEVREIANLVDSFSMFFFKMFESKMDGRKPQVLREDEHQQQHKNCNEEDYEAELPPHAHLLEHVVHLLLRRC